MRRVVVLCVSAALTGCSDSGASIYNAAADPPRRQLGLDRPYESKSIIGQRQSESDRANDYYPCRGVPGRRVPGLLSKFYEAFALETVGWDAWVADRIFDRD
jgi:hypothetical protein